MENDPSCLKNAKNHFRCKMYAEITLSWMVAGDHELTCSGEDINRNYFLTVVHGQRIGTTMNGAIIIEATKTQGTKGNISQIRHSAGRPTAD